MQNRGAIMESYIESHTDPAKALEYERLLDEEPLYRYAFNRERQILERILTDYFGSTPVDMLDFACGTGRISASLEDKVRSAKGVDVSEPMLEMARRKLRRTELHRGNLIQERLFEGAQFNLITAFRFFLNAEPELRVAVLRALAPLLRKGGYLVFNNHRNLDSFYMRLAQAYRRWRRLPAINMLTMGQCREFLAEAGFEIVHIYAIGILHLPKARLPKWVYRTVDAVGGASQWLAAHSETPIIVARRRDSDKEA